MTSGLRLLILANWTERGEWWLLSVLKGRGAMIKVLQPLSLPARFGKRLARLSFYWSDFYVPLFALLRRSRFDIVISWQMRIGIFYGLLNRLLGPRKRALHLIQDFHIDLTPRRGFYRLNLALLKLAIPGIDYFCCTSTEEEAIYSRMFGIPRSRIAFLPLAESSSNFEEPDRPKKDHIFAFGQSDRDFDTLIRAVTPLEIRTFILSGSYRPTVPLPGHVSILRDRVSAGELVQWIAESRLVVIPTKDYAVSAGQISMLEVMALARPLIVTENMATREYATHMDSALFFRAGNHGELAGQIQTLWNNGELAEQIGRQARQTALKLKERQTRVFTELLERCAMDIQKGENHDHP